MMVAEVIPFEARTLNTDGVVAPSDHYAEQALVAACLINVERADQALALASPDDFFHNECRRIWRAIGALRSENQVTDIVTVASWLNAHGELASVGGTDGIIRLCNGVEAIQNVTAYARNVRSMATRRRVMKMCEQAAGELRLGRFSELREYLAELEQKLYAEARTETAGDDPVRLSEVSKAVFRDLSQGAPEAGLHTRLAEYDRITGGMQRQAVTVVGALRSMGKSVFVMNAAVQVARAGHGVLICSLEMTKEELLQRCACGESNVPGEALARREITQDQWTRYTAAHCELAQLPIYIADEPGQTLATILGKARRVDAQLKREGKELRLVVVDYLQLVKPLDGKKNRTREQEVSEISRGLKGLAKATKVHVLAACQLNDDGEKRAGDKKRPRMSDLRESRAIVNDADIVTLIHRDNYEAERDNRENREFDVTAAELIVAKNRSLIGRTGVAHVGFQGARFRFCNVERT